MKQSIDILRLACLIQDRDNQDFKRVVLSIVFELIYENSNVDLKADELFQATITKSKEPIDRDFFDGLITNSKSFVITNTEDEPLVRLSSEKFNEVENSISEFSIEPSIDSFLNTKKLNPKFKQSIIDILYQSIYENIYAFNPSNTETLIPDVVKKSFTQEELDAFNAFLEYDDPQKNSRLYNQFVKAIEFAILTSGQGVKKFTSQIYTDKSYILDTNIIFRMLGVGGIERQETILNLIESCIKQGVKFKFTLRTHQELNNTLDASIIKISKGEQTKKIEIIQDLVAEAPHFFNDDFIVQYSRLKNSKTVNSPEQYGIEMKTRFKSLCKKYSIEQADLKIKLESYEVSLFAKKLISERKKLTNYRYSLKQATVDSYNVLYVRKKRGDNNYNYSEVKSFYLTTDRGLNKILSEDPNIKIPATILPSQLFAIHNPLTSDNEDELDYSNFFSFVKRRTSEFKHRGRDVFSFIQQAQVYSTDKEEIKELILTFTDERYNHSKNDAVNENVIVRFKDFAKTYFDKRLDEIENIEEKFEEIEQKGKAEIQSSLNKSKTISRTLDALVTVLIIPLIALAIGLISDWKFSIVALIVLEGFKFWLTTKGNYNQAIWEYFFTKSMKKKAYFKLTKNDQFIKEGLSEISNSNGSIWK